MVILTSYDVLYPIGNGVFCFICLARVQVIVMQMHRPYMHDFQALYFKQILHALNEVLCYSIE